jgi:hypothetical protein
MNLSQQVERTHEAVGGYVEAIGVPEYDADAVRARISTRRPYRSAPRAVAAVLAACAILAVFIVGSPVVIAQVERMLQGFATINGQTVQVAVSSVTLEQARRDMPFTVIAPRGIPPGLSEHIDELNPSSSKLDSHLIFRFNEGNKPPELTISESAAHGTSKDQMRMLMTEGTRNGGVLPALPSASSGQYVTVELGNNGQALRQIKLEPITWTVRGTRVDLISPPGMLSAAQLAAIRREMSL